MCVVVNSVVYVWYMCGSECCSFRATHADRTHSTPSLVDLDHVTYRTHGPTRAGSPEPIARTLYMHSHNCYLKKSVLDHEQVPPMSTGEGALVYRPTRWCILVSWLR